MLLYNGTLPHGGNREPLRAYLVVASRVARSLQASGFESAAGFLHSDAEGRHSLTYDVLELLRADIDNAILPWVASHTWKRQDFPVTPEGIVRLQPTLAAVVAQRGMRAQRDVDVAVGWLTELLLPARKVSTGRAAATL
ncbi:MAG: CRISPR-associated endonuclease Cas1 [Rhodomicrobium sp.]